jgi:hypothetical protein
MNERDLNGYYASLDAPRPAPKEALKKSERNPHL